MRLKLFLRYPVDIRRARRILEGRADPAPQFPARPLVLDLRTPQLMFDCGRHFQSIAYYASRSGSATYLRCGEMLLGGISRKQFGGEMLAQPYVYHLPTDHPIPDDALVIGDYEPNQQDRKQFAPRTTYLRMLIGRDIDRSIPVMPYPMHPATLRTLDQCDLAEMRRNQDERNAILFAGSQKARYGDSWMLREFGILSRLEVIETLKSAYGGRIESTMRGEVRSRPIVILDSRSVGIPAERWLAALSQSRFFLCCPGGRQPLCHNLIEAMSVGTIPLIEYGDRITPELRDEETAICFRGRQGLKDAIKRIDAMSSVDLQAMGRRVAEFYDRHLCGIEYIRRLRDGSIDATSGRICMPFNERNFYQTQARSAA